MNKETTNSEAAALFNNHVAEFRARIDTLIKSLLFVSGGVLSISIGAFISGNPPHISDTALSSIQYAWYSFSFSLITSLTTMFLLIIAQAKTGSEWKIKINTNREGLEVIQNPVWFRIIMWVMGVFAFVSCIVGLVYIAHGAGHLLISKP